MPLSRTLRAGERAALWSTSGRCTIVDGPKRVSTFRKKMQLLRLYAADQNQYLEVTYLDGRVEHIKGPTSLFHDPLAHKRVKECNAISLSSHEVLVVYRPAPQESGEGGKAASYTAEVERTIIHGPVMHVPYPDEWMHEFIWHGTDPNNKTRLIPKQLRFTKLRVIPDQFYYNCRDVRTADDTVITVKIMIFFELRDIQVMLDTTHDPIGDFINSLCADVVAFSAVRTYEGFLQHTAMLNDIATYPQLQQRAERMGYHVSKVVYRGYHASEELQRMHDQAIQKRTLLRLQADTAVQEQQQADMVLQRELQRCAQSQEKSESEQLHQQKLADLEYQQQLKHARAKAEEQINAQRIKHDMEIQKLRAENDEHARKQRIENEAFAQRIDHLKKAGVDLTAYLTAHYQKPDKLVQFQTTGDGAQPPVIFSTNQS